MDDYEMEGSEEEDRLSELPKPLLIKILSLLPMEDVVRTTVLSRSWENLWTTVPCLKFWDIDNSIESFRDFVNRALIFWEGTHILKFEIVVEHHTTKPLASDMDVWVKFAVKNKVQELKICLVWDLGFDPYVAPLCLSSCSSIRRLSLMGYSLRIHGSPAWNQLRRLTMHECCSSEQLISQILLGTPQLRVFDLRFQENNEDLNIQSASLKKLYINKYGDEPSPDAVLKICCPNLETFKIVELPYYKFLLTNASSLTDAAFGFDYWDGEAENELSGETMGQILRFIQHVEELALSECFIQVLGASLREYLFSPLLNVKFLELHRHGRIDLGLIVNILGIFPNIKMLVVWDNHHLQHYKPECNVLEFETKLSKSFLWQLKTIKITSRLMCASSFRFIEFLLKHACMLEKLVVCAQNSTETRSLEVAKELQNIPRSSPSAKVVFETRR